MTIDICHLNRRELRDERVNAETHVKGRAALIWTLHFAGTDWSNKRFGPDEAFSTYLNCKLEEELDRLLREFQKKRDGLSTG